MKLWMLLVAVVAVVLVFVLYVWYENRRSRASMRNVDHSKLKDLSKDAWEDDDW